MNQKPMTPVRVCHYKAPGIALLKKIAFAALLLFLQPGCRPVKSLGKNPSGQDLQRIERLPNYRNGQFHNLVQPPPSVSAAPPRRGFRVPSIVRWLWGKPNSVFPNRTMPAATPDFSQAANQKPSVYWFGHSTVLLRTQSANILMDPVFNSFAGPFKGMVNAFHGTDVYKLSELPPIDIVVISHDHYDHLDYKTVNDLKKTVKKFIVPVGVGSHLRHWGFDPEKVVELNWHDSIRISETLVITATPAHHRSNRTFENRKTLWASYVFNADGYKIYFSGDTGYSKHFGLIGDQYGPFDLALLECGQYNIKWQNSHMFPFQTATAARDLGAAMVIPIHWAKFAESNHRWNDPVQRLLKSADSLKVPVSVPFIGQRYTIGDPVVRDYWWNAD